MFNLNYCIYGDIIVKVFRAHFCSLLLIMHIYHNSGGYMIDYITIAGKATDPSVGISQHETNTG